MKKLYINYNDGTDETCVEGDIFEAMEEADENINNKRAFVDSDYQDVVIADEDGTTLALRQWVGNLNDIDNFEGSIRAGDGYYKEWFEL